jgi:ABC-type cobalamin/Fe3+-siderophores transport system ATPase subunit
MKETASFIDHVNVQNFRSIRDITIKDMPQILGIWGPNGSGKSNLLQAIHFLLKGPPYANSMCLQQFHISNPSEIFNKHLSKDMKMQISLHRVNGTELSRILGRNLGESGGYGQDFHDSIYLPPWRHILDKHSELTSGTTLRSIRFIQDGNITQNFINDKIGILTAAAAANDEKAIELYKIINEWASSVGLGRIAARLEAHRTTSIYSDRIDGIMDVPDAGFGGRITLPIIALTTLTDNRLILIEEPEISLHPAAQADMAERFVQVALRQNHQIFFTSHSEYLIKRFARMLKEGKVDSRIFKAMYCEKAQDLGTTYEYIEPEVLIKNLEEMRPMIPEIHKRNKSG